MKFRVGVLGATGYIGKPYRAEIRQSPDDATIVALCARRRDLLEAAQREDNAELITDDWRQVVEHPDVNFVVVATPDALHHEAMMACAAAGKHVLCEKPLGMNANEAREMWTAFRDAGLGHFVPFWSHYNPIFIRAREIYRQGTLGEVRGIVYRWLNPRTTATPFTWRDDATLSSAGCIADVGSHAYDTLRWILGQDATRVLAHADVIVRDKPDQGEVNLGEAMDWGESHATDGNEKIRTTTAYDYANIAFEMQNGAVGTLTLSHASNFCRGLAPDLELHGTKGSLSVDRFTDQITIVGTDENIRTVETIPNPGWGNRFGNHVFPALRAQLSGQPTDHPDLADGYHNQLFTDAAANSAKSGSWVEIGHGAS